MTRPLNMISESNMTRLINITSKRKNKTRLLYMTSESNMTRLIK